MKFTSETELATGHGPHLHSHAWTAVRTWGTFVLLFLALIPAMVTTGLKPLISFVIIIASCIMSDLLWQVVFEKRELKELSLSARTLVHGALLALIFPHGQWPLLVSAAVATIMIGEKLFGGYGEYIFHPVLVGYVIVETLFPPIALLPNSAQASGLWVALVGLAPVFMRWVRWEIPVFFIVGLFLFRGGIDFWLIPGSVWAAAFFLAADSVTSPITVFGRILFAFSAGVLTSSLSHSLQPMHGVSHAILLMNAGVPLMDLLRKPRRKR